MRHFTIAVTVVLAFVAGLLVSPMTRLAPPDAHSQSAMTPMMIDLAGMKHADMPATAIPTMNAKALVVSDSGTVGIQSGNVNKHIHEKTDEIQYISRKIVKTLVAAGRLEVDDEPRVTDAIARVIADELSIEDRLNEEARGVLAQHMTHMERSDITYSEMFKKVKRELAKKKGIVL